MSTAEIIISGIFVCLGAAYIIAARLDSTTQASYWHVDTVMGQPLYTPGDCPEELYETLYGHARDSDGTELLHQLHEAEET